ncbi:MAG TPA: TrmH family RNA methyltransferase [Solirubrobacteraceae bacterium]|nr:TrmH family RNA methyltransferase [Solirubrobacteraceae bacterium]
MEADPVAEAFAAARTDERLVLVEGFHALKHALRFGADVVAAATEDAAALERLAERLAPDVRPALSALLAERPLERLVARAPHTGVVAVARRPRVDVAALLAAAPGPPVVLLEDPRHLGNVGAVVRVAAAAGAAGVLTTGARDAWDPAALRGSAGLHFALPVGRADLSALGDRPLIVLDPGGDELAGLPEGALLAFGTERDGVTVQLAARADARLRIPMRAGVSSLNLATAVAVVLYAGWSGFSQRSIVHTERMPTDS